MPSSLFVRWYNNRNIGNVKTRGMIMSKGGGTLYFCSMEDYLDAVRYCIVLGILFEGTEVVDPSATMAYTLQILGVSDGQG
jgi:hypothetical protein